MSTSYQLLQKIEIVPQIHTTLQQATASLIENKNAGAEINLPCGEISCSTDTLCISLDLIILCS